MVINPSDWAKSPYLAGNAPVRHLEGFGYGDIDSF